MRVRIRVERVRVLRVRVVREGSEVLSWRWREAVARIYMEVMVVIVHILDQFSVVSSKVAVVHTANIVGDRICGGAGRDV